MDHEGPEGPFGPCLVFVEPAGQLHVSVFRYLKGTDGPGNLKVSCMSRSHCSRHNWPLQVQHSFRVSVPARYSQAVGLRRLRTELEPEAW